MFLFVCISDKILWNLFGQTSSILSANWFCNLKLLSDNQDLVAKNATKGSNTVSNKYIWKYRKIAKETNHLQGGSCTAEVEIEFTTWAWVQANTHHCSGGGQPSFFYLLTYVNECKWVDHDESWLDWVYCFYEPGDRTRRPLPIAVPAVAWTQAQVVNSNSTSSGKETPCKHIATKNIVVEHNSLHHQSKTKWLWLKWSTLKISKNQIIFRHIKTR